MAPSMRNESQIMGGAQLGNEDIAAAPSTPTMIPGQQMMAISPEEMMKRRRKKGVLGQAMGPPSMGDSMLGMALQGAFQKR